MNFDRFTYPCYYLQFQATIDLYSITIAFPFLEFHVNEITFLEWWNILFHVYDSGSMTSYICPTHQMTQLNLANFTVYKLYL